MKAVRLTQPSRPLELMQMDVAALGPTDILIAVRAAGICHSDAHYRAGKSRVHPLPLTLGHEVAGVVAQVGAEASGFKAGDRVCLHYLATCGTCDYCARGNEQFCGSGAMIGKYRDGGYAEFIAMPARSVFHLPDGIPFDQGAVMMCSSATSFHALRKARLRPGESVAIFGAGGLGVSAIQLARAMGAGNIFAVDINPGKLKLADELGAVALDGSKSDPVVELKRRTEGRGVDVALELIGLPTTMRQSVQCLAIQGRAALVGIMDRTFEIAPYEEILNKEAEIIGVSDHLASELPQLIEWVRQRKLDLSRAITRTVPLDAAAINATLDELERFGSGVRVVITP